MMLLCSSSCNVLISFHYMLCFCLSILSLVFLSCFALVSCFVLMFFHFVHRTTRCSTCFVFFLCNILLLFSCCASCLLLCNIVGFPAMFCSCFHIAFCSCLQALFRSGFNVTLSVFTSCFSLVLYSSIVCFFPLYFSTSSILLSSFVLFNVVLCFCLSETFVLFRFCN